MNIKTIIQSFQDTFNAAPCADCGGHHQVKLSVSGTETAPVVTVSFPDGACDVFKLGVNEYIKKHCEDFSYPVTSLFD